MANKQIHQLNDITFPVDPTQSYIMADMYDTDSNTYKAVRIETTQLVPTLKTTLEQGNVTDGHNINISSNDRIISTPLAAYSQADVNIRFLSGRAYRLDFVPIEDIPDTILYVNPVGGNGADLKLALYFNLSDELIDIKIVVGGYNYVIGDVVTVLESESGIPDFTVTITNTYGSVNNKGAVEWIFTGPGVDDSVGNSALILDTGVELFGSRSVKIYTPDELKIETDTSGIFLGENYINLSLFDKSISISNAFIQMFGDVILHNDLQVNGAINHYSGAFLLAGGTFDVSGPSSLISTGNNQIYGPTTINNTVIDYGNVTTTIDTGGGNTTKHNVEVGLIEMEVTGAGEASIVISALPITGNGSIIMNSQGKFESIVDSGFVSSSIVQNASNITTTSDEIWMFAGMSGIEMGTSQIDLSSTKFNYNGSEVARKNDTGWASYKDTVYTSGSPFTILDTLTSTLPNNAGTVINTELPEGVSSFYNSGTSKITPQFAGDYYTFTIRFKAKNSATLGGYMDFGIDIGGSLGVIFKETLVFPKGAGVEHNFTISCPGYSAATFVANGGLVKLTAGGGDLTVYDIEYQITRVHKKI